jgi:hypothetical protein
MGDKESRARAASRLGGAPLSAPGSTSNFTCLGPVGFPWLRKRLSGYAALLELLTTDYCYVITTDGFSLSTRQRLLHIRMLGDPPLRTRLGQPLEGARAFHHHH